MKHFYTLLLLISISFYAFPQQAYYNGIDFDNLSGSDLKDALATRIISTHTNPLNYIWEACQNTDLDPMNNSNVLLIYGWENGTDGDVTNDLYRDVNNNGGSVGDWNREHTYPNSLGTPKLETGGKNMTSYSDAHNLRASDVQRNGQRGNKKFAAGSGNSKTVNGGTDWYPGDEWRGDVARVIMYMYLRYDSQCLPSNVSNGNTNALDSNMIDLLLYWNEADKVSAYEDARNTYHTSGDTYSQGNRNPFIDQPYLANMIWGIPAGQNAAEDRWNLLSINEYPLSSVKIYPNPLKNDYLNIKTKTSLSIEIYNVLGKRVLTNKVDAHNKTINVSSLAKGVYLVKLSSKNGSTTKKLVKQ
ncbi:endonuclease [Gelatiniphilus marinus]|uniref:Endonuclease n=1 Tax=Gelatiniphilus marinus TaxID=1759464 RepID=A0ABW5JR18_9FLAO